MTNQELQLVAKQTIKTRNRANVWTFIAGMFSIIYGISFACIMPGIEAIVLGSIITAFGILVFAFSVVARVATKKDALVKKKNNFNLH